MTRALARDATFQALWPVRLLACCLLLALIVALPQEASAATHASDDFNRAAGSLGADWTNTHDGGLSISAQAVTGRGGLAGDIWTAGTFTSDQYSQIGATSKQLTGGQWIGVTVRAQNGGRDAYVGIYFWNGGRPELLLFARSGGSWTELGNYRSRPLAAGTQLKLVAVGSTIVFLENGVPRLSVSDGSLSRGASWDFPADMSSYNQLGADPAFSYGTDANFQANYRLTTAFVNANKGPFLKESRIWIGGSRAFPVDISDYAKLLTKEGIFYTKEVSRFRSHSWDSGWVPFALAASRHDSIKFRQYNKNLPLEGHVPSVNYPLSIRWLYK